MKQADIINLEAYRKSRGIAPYQAITGALFYPLHTMIAFTVLGLALYELIWLRRSR